MWRRGHAFEGIDDRHHSPGPRDLAALQAAGVARAVPALVVRERDGAGELEERIVVLADDFRADCRMPLELLALRAGQGSLLAQELGRNAELADVVQLRCPHQEGARHLARAGCLGERARILREPSRAFAAERAVVPLHRTNQARHALFASLELRGALVGELLQPRLDARAEHRRGQRLHEEINRAQPEGLYQVLRIAPLGEEDHRHLREAGQRS